MAGYACIEPLLPNRRPGDRNIIQATFLPSKLWDPKQYPTLGVAFMGGTEKQHKFVEHIITTQLQPLMTKIQFKWNVPPNQSQIRISFKANGGSQSAVGTDALQYKTNEPTMNLGWLDDDVSYENNPKKKNTGAVVKHEFMHGIAAIHEHQSPKSALQWNKEVVYNDKRFKNQRPPWTKADIDRNIFEKYGDAELCKIAKNPLEKQRFCEGLVTNGSEYDPTSIMHYFYPPEWTKTATVFPENVDYSPLDKEWIMKYYSEPSDKIPETVTWTVSDTIPKIPPTVTVHTPFRIGKIQENYTPFVWDHDTMAILFYILVGIVLLIVFMSVVRTPCKRCKSPRQRKNPTS